MKLQRCLGHVENLLFWKWPVAKNAKSNLSVAGLVEHEPSMKRADWMFLAIFANMKDWHLLTVFLSYMNSDSEQALLHNPSIILR